MIHPGGCHCGNLRFELDSGFALAQLPLRACQCSFCRSHGALSTSDPLGRVRFQVRDLSCLIRYRFSLRTADFLVCGACGVYVAAVVADAAQAWAIVNASALDEVAQLTQPVTPMNYDAETEAQRLARRKARWTPIEGAAP